MSSYYEMVYDRDDVEESVINSDFWEPFNELWEDGDALALGKFVNKWLDGNNALEFPFALVQEALGLYCQVLSKEQKEIIGDSWLYSYIASATWMEESSRFEFDNKDAMLGSLLFLIGKDAVGDALELHGFYWNQDLLEEGIYRRFDTYFEEDGFLYYKERSEYGDGI